MNADIYVGKNAWPFFYASEMKLVANRFYKVYVAHNVLCGAYIAGHVFNETNRQNLARSMGIVVPLSNLWLQRYVEKRYAREKEADAIDPVSADFMALHKYNFQFHVKDIHGATLRACAYTTAYPSIGENASAVLELNLKERRRSFFIVENVGPREIYLMLKPLAGTVRYELPEKKS
ncbi:MAG: hypothetical protein KJ052_05625 [Candidatus Hydrogenedentes bacterium]|nr:hypothetical protein [Candidatus Hydrogenedentota bacterium]